MGVNHDSCRGLGGKSTKWKTGYLPHAETLPTALGKTDQVVIERESPLRGLHPAVRIEAERLWENILIRVDEVADLAYGSLETVLFRVAKLGESRGLGG
jgi:hypothetical protein